MRETIAKAFGLDAATRQTAGAQLFQLLTRLLSIPLPLSKKYAGFLSEVQPLSAAMFFCTHSNRGHSLQKATKGQEARLIEGKEMRIMKKTYLILTVTLLMIVLITMAAQAKVIRDAIWADGELFGVTLTPNDVPVKGPFDAPYNFDNSGLEGQRSVSESKPGDQDYNGGRWKVLPVTFTPQGISVHDPDGDGTVNFELKSAEEVTAHVGLGHVTIGDPVRYFVCPLHPQKNEYDDNAHYSVSRTGNPRAIGTR